MDTMMLSTQAEIVRALRTEFDDGFTLLVEAYQPGIYSGALRFTRSREDAQEVAQDTFLRAYRALEQYDDARIDALQVRAWLWTIAVNLCRTRARRARPTSSLPRDDVLGAELDTHFDNDDWNRRLDALSSPQRTAVVLRHVVDLPVTEIAAITGRPIGTVKADISRGLKKLRTTLESEMLK